MTRQERMRRRFSEAFRREKVEMIEKGLVSISEISREYEVSRTAIDKWRKKFGSLAKQERLVVEKASEGHKSKELLKKLQHREQEIGRQQIEIRYLQEVIKYWSEQLGEDLEKKVERSL